MGGLERERKVFSMAGRVSAMLLVQSVIKAMLLQYTAVYNGFSP